MKDDAGVFTLSIDRPKALNALDQHVLELLLDQVHQLRDRPELRALILTGVGDKAFVAGADVKAMAEMPPQKALEFSQLGHRVMSAIEAFPVPVLAAVNGFALGGGLELALAADIIYASDNAKLGQPEVNLGLIPGFGGTVRLGRRIGWQRAKELIYTGDTIDAQKALSMGLVAAVYPQATLQQEVSQIARKIASRGPLAVRASKQVMQRAQDVEVSTGLVIEQQAFALLFSQHEQREGCAAFLDKRPAQFKGIK